VRSIVREGAPRSFRTPPRPSKLDPFKDYLRKRFEVFSLSGVRLSEEIRKMGFSGSVRIVCRFLNGLRSKAPSELTTRFETPPGEQAQADWEVSEFLCLGSVYFSSAGPCRGPARFGLKHRTVGC